MSDSTDSCVWSQPEDTFAALGIEEKYAEKIPNMAALLHETKTEHLKKEGMKVTDRKKLLSHVEKYKRGLWAPKELRERT